MRQRFLLAMGAACLWFAMTTASVEADESAEVHAQLEKRIEKLESVVVRDPFRPRDTVLARLEAIEKTLAERDRSAADAARQQRKEDIDLQRTLEAITKQITRMDDRLKALERTSSKATVEPREIENLKRDLDATKRTLKSLEDRLRRLESSR